MNIILNPSHFHLGSTFFLDTKSNIIMDGNFTKIIYSSEWFSMNGIYLSFNIHPCINNTKLNIKNILYYPVFSSENQETIQQLVEIEKRILNYYQQINSSSKTVVYTLRNQLQNGMMKFYKKYNNDYNSSSSSSSKYFIKISGIWENNNDFGITYKIIEYQK